MIGAARQVKTCTMDDARYRNLATDVAAALDWWRDAGVDLAYADDPTDWLAKPEPRQPAAPPAPAAKAASPARTFAPSLPAGPAIDPATIPTDLAAFRDWWLTEPALDNGRTSGRVAPRGPAQAGLMVLVPDPEPEDGDTLLSGPQGRLVAAMVTAMGVGEAYVASALPRHTPAADWAGLARSGLAAVVARHIVLSAPRRLLVLGSNILPLVGHDPAQEPANLRNFNHEQSSIPLLAARSPAALLERPRWKRDLWRAWLDWGSHVDT